MEEPYLHSAPSELLRRFLDCKDSKQSESMLEQMMQVAAPIVRRIVSSKVRKPASDDVQNDVLADLIGRLHQARQSGAHESIRDFSAYSAVVAYHGCKEHYRKCFPQRYRLRSRLRYLLG